MSFNLDDIRTDADLELNGFWYSIGDAKLKIARLGNLNYRRVMREKLPDYLRETVDEDLRDKLIGEVIGATLLVGWEDLLENGKELPYSKRTAIRLMTSPEYKDLRDFVVEQANTADNYRVYRAEEIKKKLDEL